MARVMVIDDDPGIRRSLVRVLESEGHDVLEEEDGASALRHFAGDPVDLVISDVYMPDMDGVSFLMRVKEAFPEAPIIMMSGGGPLPAATVLAASKTLGAAAVLAKPFSIGQIRSAVHDALRARESTER